MRIMQEPYHLIGIGGCGMRALGKLLIEKGHPLTGSDLKESKFTEALKNEGASIWIGHEETPVDPEAIVVLSSAITEDNPELKKARAQNNKIMKRAELLAKIMSGYTTRIAIAGTHGKTSTTAMLVAIFKAAGHAPGFMIGADPNPNQAPPYTITNAEIGDGDVFITEADESDGTFLEFPANISAITNIEDDHLGFFKTRENIQSHFKKFMEKTLNKNGKLITNSEDPITQKILSEAPNWQAIQTPSPESHEERPEGLIFTLKTPSKTANIKLQTHGHHNAKNAITAATIALECNIPIEAIKKGLETYTPVARRFQEIHTGTDALEIRIIDDYAHHPTEIKTTIKTAKALTPKNARLITIFQPHRYSRTEELLEEFANSFTNTDITIITDVFTAGEPQNNRPGAKELAEKISTLSPPILIPNKDDIIAKLLPILQKNDTILTIGAGDINTIATRLSETLLKTEPIAA